MQTFMQDLMYGLRMMRRAPGFTAAAVLTLGLGIGVDAATFSVVDILSIKPLTYRDPSRVAFILVTNAASHQRGMNITLADAMEIGQQMTTLERVAAYQYWSANLTGGAMPERIQAYRVTADTFTLLGVEAAVGRTLIEADGLPDAADAIVLSDGLWRRRFGADPAVIGTTVMVDGAAHVVLGVMPPRFEFPVFNFKGEAWSAIKGTREGLAQAGGIAVDGRDRPPEGRDHLSGRASGDRHRHASPRGRLSRHRSRARRGTGRDAAPWRDLPAGSAVDDCPGRGGGRAVAGVRQRRESAAGSCRRARARTGGARGLGCRPRETRATAADGECAARRRRFGARVGCRVRGTSPVARLASRAAPRDAAECPGPRHRSVDAALHARRGQPERTAVRRRAGLEGGSGPDDGAAQIGRSRQRGISAPPPARRR